MRIPRLLLLFFDRLSGRPASSTSPVAGTPFNRKCHSRMEGRLAAALALRSRSPPPQ